MQKHRYIKYGLWMSEEEDRKLQQLCDFSGLSRAVVLRKMLMGEPIRERPNVDYRDLCWQMDRIGNNINQIARQANAAHGATDRDIADLVYEFSVLKAEVKAWKNRWL